MKSEILPQEHNLNVLTAKVELILSEIGFKTSEPHFIDARESNLYPVPAELHEDVFKFLKKSYPDGLYSHQAEAIRKYIDDEQDICLATSISSGKSLAFMTATADLLKFDSSAKVIAFYPAKALIRDQLRKWKSLFEPLNLKLGHIDGSIKTEDRINILQNNSLILMTPDVAHAWLMSNRKLKVIDKFLSLLKMLILDEAHIYDGVFGTNMSYFLRRLQAVANIERIISSTATIGKPEEFIEKLTGRKPFVFSDKDDGSPNPPRAILLVSPSEKNFEQIAKALNKLARENVGTFLAFGDSRKTVELIVAATKRKTAKEETVSDELPQVAGLLENLNVFPYRAGYEEEDRQTIQNSLEAGKLQGVVATSALELGIDIGDIEIVILLGVPPTVKSFWQRFGRTGRKIFGLCILMDDLGLISKSPNGLNDYLKRKPEPEWLYLENKYIQYANALCAVKEIPWISDGSFKSLPIEFSQFVDNELDPKKEIPQDLFTLKQRASNSPHYEFPLRNGIEKRYKIKSEFAPLGELTLSQSMREAYPGAVYYYMARPYRVYSMNSKQGEIYVKRERFYTTQPNLQSKAFPDFKNGILQIWRNEDNFLAEVEMKVSEKLSGFIETRGNTKVEEIYEAGSNYYQKPISRLFQTTGVCWIIEKNSYLDERIVKAVFDTFCDSFGIQSRDIGYGEFYSRISPFSLEKVKGLCIFDLTYGSLRLTQKLAENFTHIVDEAYERAKFGDRNLAFLLVQFKKEVKGQNFNKKVELQYLGAVEQEWEIVFARNEKVLCQESEEDTRILVVKRFRYTPAGIRYDLLNEKDNSVIKIDKTKVFPASANTKYMKFNLYTQEEMPI
jgi:DEAD/DEAH box helicase domain-containing protein